MTLGEKQELFMYNLTKLITFARKKGFYARGKELLRTPEMQELYIKQGKSKTSKSKHLDGLAIDIIFTKDHKTPVDDKAELQEIGDYWESLDKKNNWGGNWQSLVDCPHFEYAG